MSPDRRRILQTLALGLGARAAAPAAAARERAGPSAGAPGGPSRALPPDFLWGTAISAHQSEGNNVNSDAWIRENVRPTLFKERSGDACDSYHRYAQDLALAASLGFNAYRLGIEWARIEPSEGAFSPAELDHYARVLDACHERGLKPVVTFNHFTVPAWFAARGGFEVDDAPALFARFCDRAARRLGSRMHLATTFNEANIGLLVRMMPQHAASLPAARAMMAAAARATGSPRFSSLAYADADLVTPRLQQAHREGFEAIKAAVPALPVGLTLTTQDIQSVAAESLADAWRERLYGGWVAVGRSHADFIGVQTYTRFLVDADGLVEPPAGAERTAAGYEFYPQALANTLRWAHRTFAKPVHVTENGIATDDDTRRIAFIDQALAGLRACLDEGIPVHSYLYWSLLDNFEWTAGYAQHFGLAAVDRQTFARTPRPSAFHLGAIARANRL